MPLVCQAGNFRTPLRITMHGPYNVKHDHHVCIFYEPCFMFKRRQILNALSFPPVFSEKKDFICFVYVANTSSSYEVTTLILRSTFVCIGVYSLPWQTLTALFDANGILQSNELAFSYLLYPTVCHPAHNGIQN